jgi:hypothetical protein
VVAVVAAVDTPPVPEFPPASVRQFSISSQLNDVWHAEKLPGSTTASTKIPKTDRVIIVLPFIRMYLEE